MQIMPFDGGRVFDVAPAYNGRIKRSKAAADFAWRKAVLSDNFIATCGPTWAKFRKGIYRKKKRQRERESAQSELR